MQAMRVAPERQRPRPAGPGGASARAARRRRPGRQEGRGAKAEPAPDPPAGRGRGCRRCRPPGTPDGAGRRRATSGSRCARPSRARTRPAGRSPSRGTGWVAAQDPSPGAPARRRPSARARAAPGPAHGAALMQLEAAARRTRRRHGGRRPPTSTCAAWPPTRAAYGPATSFFALAGRATDGRRHVAEALARGAAVVVARDARSTHRARSRVRCGEPRRLLAHVAARLAGDPSAALTLVGVTGTNGKTTTTYLLEGIWRAAGARPGVIGTIAYRFGDEQPAGAVHHAGGARAAGAARRDARRPGVTHVAIEVSSHALAQQRADGLRFDAAAFTQPHARPPRLPRRRGGVLRRQGAALPRAAARVAASPARPRW